MITRTFQDQTDFPGISRSWKIKGNMQDFPGFYRMCAGFKVKGHRWQPSAVVNVLVLINKVALHPGDSLLTGKPACN